VGEGEEDKVSEGEDIGNAMKSWRQSNDNRSGAEVNKVVQNGERTPVAAEATAGAAATAERTRRWGRISALEELAGVRRLRMAALQVRVFTHESHGGC
jgi:hypothetical protein